MGRLYHIPAGSLQTREFTFLVKLLFSFIEVIKYAITSRWLCLRKLMCKQEYLRCVSFNSGRFILLILSVQIGFYKTKHGSFLIGYELTEDLICGPRHHVKYFPLDSSGLPQFLMSQ